MLSLLSAAERSRCERFRFEAHRARFRAAHVALRSVLAAYVDRAADRLNFECSRYGKPRLTRASGGDECEFNMSYAGDLAAFVVSRRQAVGVDIESIREFDRLHELASSYFTISEAMTIAATPAPSTFDRFFRCWTRKEAYVKGCGTGLNVPLDSFDVQPGSSGPILLMNWTIVDVEAPSNIACAVAVRGTECEVTCRHW
jgi:4'-phosphopantetheinyl transferase